MPIIPSPSRPGSPSEVITSKYSTCRSYAPELNPDKRLNADVKHAIGAKVPVRTKSKLKAAAEDHMTTIGKSPERVRAYFRDPRVKYAA